MNFKKLAIFCALVLFGLTAQSQKIPTVKHFDTKTTDQFQIDYDSDGDLDIIMAGVVPEKNQGRIYLIENKGGKFAKPEHIYSFPTVAVKQNLDITIQDKITTINTLGTSTTGEQRLYIGSLDNGEFAGMILQPATYASQD